MRQYKHAIIDLKPNQYIVEDVTLFHLQLSCISPPPRLSTYFSYTITTLINGGGGITVGGGRIFEINNSRDWNNRRGWQMTQKW